MIVFKLFKFLMLTIGSFKFSELNISIFTMAILLGSFSTMGNNTFMRTALAQSDRTIEGRSGGSTDSNGCGFIADRPNYEMNLEQRVDYMRFTVQADGGQPTLLVIGPSANDSFCVLGDRVSGLKPEISGVWEAGSYQIYVGDRQGVRHQFTLNISTNN
jgi:hypothetical protein